MKNKYLRHARISEREFRAILALFCADVEALKASRLTKVNKNTTHRIYGLLRRRVVELANAEAAPFAGCVEVDESYFGPRRVAAFVGVEQRGRSQLSAFSKEVAESFVPPCPIVRKLNSSR